MNFRQVKHCGGGAQGGSKGRVGAPLWQQVCLCPSSLAWPQMPRLHSCPLLHLHQLRSCLSPHCPGGPGPQEASSAWLLVVLHVPGPLYPRVHYREPQRGRDRGQRCVERIQAAEQGLTMAQPGCLSLRHQEGTSRDLAQLTRVTSVLSPIPGEGCWPAGTQGSARRVSGPRGLLLCRSMAGGVGWSGSGCPGARAAASVRGSHCIGRLPPPPPNAEGPHQTPQPNSLLANYRLAKFLPKPRL